MTDQSNVARFSAAVLERGLKSVYWCTSSAQERKGWRRASFFGDAGDVNKDVQAMARKYHLGANEIMLSVEQQGRMVLRLSPNAAERIGIEKLHVLPKGEAYGAYVDALMEAARQEASPASAGNTFEFLHEQIMHGTKAALPAVEQKAFSAGKAMAAVFLKHAHACGMPSHKEDAALEALLTQAEKEAFARSFPHVARTQRADTERNR